MTTTATQPTTRELPTLRKDRVHPALDGLEGFEIVAKHRQLFAKAVRARAAWQDAEQAVQVAKQKDEQAASDAAYAGESGSSAHPNEDKAARVAIAAHDKAVAHTNAVQRALDEVAATVRGEAGAAALADEHEHIKAVRLRIAENPDLSTADIVELGARLGFAKWLAEARNPNRFSPFLPSAGGDAPPPVHLGGVWVDSLTVIEHTRVQLSTDEPA
jgi:hypothetical protein